MTHTGAVVVGAGPAGAIAATCIARSGRDVALVDPGPKKGPVIGETLTAHAAEMLGRYNLPGPLNDTRHVPISGTVSAWDGPPVIETALSSPGGSAWRLDRVAFDAALVAAARAAGAGLIQGKIRSLRWVEKRWILSFGGGTMTASMVVDATGRRGLVDRTLGIPRHWQDRQIAVWAVGTSPAELSTTKTLIQAADSGWWYGAILPSGRPIAAYHCPVEETLALRHRPESWHALLRDADVLASQLDLAVFADATLQFTDAGGSASSVPAGPGWVACGDAAIAFDPIAAQGLQNAVRTGLAAAKVLAGGKPACTEYCKEIRKVWSQYLDRHRVLQARLLAGRQGK